MAFYSTIAEAAASDDLLSTLGINWQLLIIQIVAFTILVALLGKFVYPWLMKSVDERQKNIEEAQKASVEAQKMANSSKLEVEELLADARKEAAEIVSTAKEESAEIVSSGEEKARASAERIAKEAKADIARDVEAAKKSLHNETIELVALATEKVVGRKYSKDIDSGVIADAIKDNA